MTIFNQFVIYESNIEQGSANGDAWGWKYEEWAPLENCYMHDGKNNLTKQVEIFVTTKKEHYDEINIAVHWADVHYRFMKEFRIIKKKYRNFLLFFFSFF